MNESDRQYSWREIGLPFATFTLIWSATWIVIRDQLGTVSPQWSVTYRFLIAAAGMGVVARLQGHSLRPNRGLIGTAAVLGLCQFCINFNCVYVAERFITSGLVATVFALLLIPNSLLAWAFLRQRPSGRFVVSALVAVAGITLLFVHELHDTKAQPHEMFLGIALTLAGMIGASISNVFQALEHVRRHSISAMLTWAMAIGALGDGIIAYAVTGPPTLDSRPGYWFGLLFLSLLASVLAFSLYYPVVRKLGPGKAAYSSALVPIVAMALSTAFEGYRWTLLAGCGAALAIGGMLVAIGGRTRGPIADAEPAS